MITLYARKEPTTDSTLVELDPNTTRKDVVLYTDRECTNIKARWSWDKNPPDRRFKNVELNCYTWNLVWV